jgi:hypothetical protein
VRPPWGFSTGSSRQWTDVTDAQLRKELARMANADDKEQTGITVIQVLGDHRLCIGAHEAQQTCL